MKLLLTGRLLEVGLLPQNRGLDGLVFEVDCAEGDKGGIKIIHKTQLVVAAPRPVVEAWATRLYDRVTITVEVPDAT